MWLPMEPLILLDIVILWKSKKLLLPLRRGIFKYILQINK